jgi:SAM-dependent methyltransferase
LADTRDHRPQDFCPSTAELKRSFFAAGPTAWRAGREAFNGFIPDGARVLDAGCANGLLLKSLLAWRPASFTPFGFDIREDLIDEARQMFGQAYASHFFVLDFFDPWPEPTYDVVIAPWVSDVDLALRYRFVQSAMTHATSSVLFYCYDDCLIGRKEIELELQAGGFQTGRYRQVDKRVSVLEALP